DFVLYAGYLMTAERVGDSLEERRPEFTTWRKVGRPLVSQPQSIAALMACYPSGLFVAERHAWGWMGGVPRETAAFIEAAARPVDLPEAAGIVAYRWAAAAPAEIEEPTEAVSPGLVPPGAAAVGTEDEAVAASFDARCVDIRRARR